MARKELAVAEHLDEDAALVVAGRDERLERAPRLGGRRRRGEHEGALDRGSGRFWVDDFDRVAGLHVGGAVGSGNDELCPVDADHPPEIERLTKLDVLRMPPATTQPRAADQRVHPAPQSPEHVAGIPAIPAADPTDRGVHARRIGVDRHRPSVREDRAAGPRRITGNRTGHAPPRFNRPVLDLPQRPGDRLPSPDRRMRHQPLGIVVAHHDPVSQALGQGPRDPIRHRGDEVDPQ